MRNTKREWDFHLEDHPEALVLDQDDEFVVLAFKISKRRLTGYLHFLQQLAQMRVKMTIAVRSPAPLSTVSSVPMTPTHTTSPDRGWAELPQVMLWITVLAAVAKFKKWFFENHAGLCSSKWSCASTSFARGSVRVHDDSGTACCFKREHRVNVAFQLPPATIATSIGRHTVRRSVSERRGRVDRARQ